MEQSVLVSKRECFKADFHEMEKIHHFVSEICRDIPGDEESFSSEMQLAIHETFTNIVEHGFARESSEILIEGCLMTEGVLFKIYDEGKPFYCESLRSISQGHDSGFGCYLIKNIATHTYYKNKSPYFPRNCLSVYKKFPGEETWN